MRLPRPSPTLGTSLLVVTISVLATLVMTWPLAREAATGVQDHGDPLLQIWTLRWDLHQLARDPLRLYEANSFTPFPLPLAYSESMLTTAMLFAPLYWLTGNDILAYNLLLLFTFAASVVTATWLARELTGRTSAALLAGLAFAFMPYRFGHLSHLNLLSLQWLPLVILCLLRYLRTAQPGWAAGFAVAFLLQALSSFYYAYLAAIASAIVLLVRPPWRDGLPLRRRLIGLAGAGLVIGLVLTPISLPYFTVRQVMDFERSPSDVEALSATPRSYMAVAPGSTLYERRLPQRYPNPLFPGLTVVSLALIGLLRFGRRRPDPSPASTAESPGRLRLVVLMIGLTGLALSFGPTVVIGPWTLPMPYGLLYEYLPGVKGLRDVARFGVLALLALALLAAAGLGWLGDQLTRRPWVAHLMAVVASLTLLAELANSSVRADPVPRDSDTLAAYDWLATQPHGLVMEFPADGVVNGRSVTTITRYMYYSTRHWQPLVQGYSGFVPPLHYELMASFPDDRRAAIPSHLNVGNVGLLRDLGVRYVLFHRLSYSGGGWRLVQENLSRIDGLRLVGQLGQTWVYELDQAGRLPVQAELIVPNRPVAGQPIEGYLALQNPNPTRAAYGFGGRATLTLTWQIAGQPDLTRTLTFQPGAIVAPGTRLQPLDLGPAPPAGAYQLQLASTDARLQPLLPTTARPIMVQPTGAGVVATAPPRLARLTWPTRAFRPGETIPLALTWEAGGPLPGETIFCQLISPTNTIVGQRDGDPLDGRRPLASWQTGETIEDRRDLVIDPATPPGRYHLLVGLYSQTTGQRRPIHGPTTTAPAPELWLGPIEVVVAAR